jgi:choline-sulfatase
VGREQAVPGINAIPRRAAIRLLLVLAFLLPGVFIFLAERSLMAQESYAGASPGVKPIPAGTDLPNADRPRPNIIVIISDEHDAAVTGCYGDPVARTPNLDRLAREGIRMTACYTASPLCAPARHSFLAGKYVNRTRVWANNFWIENDNIYSLPRLLNEAGYQSYLCGKMHLDKTKRYGYTELGNFNSDFKNGTGKRLPYNDPKINLKSWQERTAEFYTAETSGGMRHDLQVTSLALQFIKNRPKDGKPFYLQVGYITPHFPLIVPNALYQHYQNKIPSPIIPQGFLDEQVTNYQQLRRAFGYVSPDPAVIKKGRELYWALTEWMDGQVGQLLETIRQSGLEQNTVIIYTADHGENKGDHGMWWKNNMYEQSARVPLIIRYPRRWSGGRVLSGVCSQVDIAATLVEIGGAKVPSDWDGRSMLAHLDNERTPWRNYAISEYYAHYIASGFTMYREGDFKYVYHNRFDPQHPGEHELYSLKDDPGEFHNLARLPQWQSKVTEMRRRLVEILKEDPDQIELRCRQDMAVGYSRPKPTSAPNKKKSLNDD